MTHPTKALHKFMMQDFVRMRYFASPSRHILCSYAIAPIQFIVL